MYTGGDWVYTNKIKDANDSANEVTLVVRGKNILPYLNGEKQRLLEDIKRTDGKIGLVSYQDYGTTPCTFENSWVWAFDKPSK